MCRTVVLHSTTKLIWCLENPHLDLRTTWKRRCLNGLKQRDPNSADACHKPARGAFSKYCSDECGVQYMHMRISLWVDNGGNRDRLWETVKNAERREGVVVSARALEGQSRSPLITGDQAMLATVPPNISKADRELARLRARLETLVQTRETLKVEMDVVAWREKVTELAIQHADTIEQCGWDQRLCFGEEEVAEFGASVLESYEENHAQADVDGTQEEAEWWCTGKKKCDRHSGCVCPFFMDRQGADNMVNSAGKSCVLLTSSLTKRRRTRHCNS